MRLLLGDCREVMRTLPDASVDSVVTDPPYELGFMGKAWDSSGVAYDVSVWRECLRVLKPGGHLLAFGGSRTYHRLACAVEDAGFEIRDQIMWVYGSGFPKSLDVSKAIDREAGAVGSYGAPKTAAHANRQSLNVPEGWSRPWMQDAEAMTRANSAYAPATEAARRWQGWGTALKPAHEPIVVARRPLIGTVAENVLAFGTGAVNVDGCRVRIEPWDDIYATNPHTVTKGGGITSAGLRPHLYRIPSGRWPANLIHDGSAEVVERFPDAGGGFGKRGGNQSLTSYGFAEGDMRTVGYGDSGSAARFFYTAKADAEDRDQGCEGFSLIEKAATWGDVGPVVGNPRKPDNGHVQSIRNHHPTVKPTDLMRYLCRLVTPPGGIVLDPFMGSGSTGKAAALERFDFIGIERQPEYLEIARARIAWLGEAPEVTGDLPQRSMEPARGAQLTLVFA